MNISSVQTSSLSSSLGLKKLIGVEGGAILEYTHGKLKDLYQHDPVRIVFPTQSFGDINQAVVVTTAGGLTGGDRIKIDVSLKDGSHVLVVAQAAEKIYRSAEFDTCVDINLATGVDCWLEYLPQETILFDGARLRRNMKVDIHPSARGLAGEILVFGRRGSGESYTKGYVKDAWEVHSAGRLVWADTFLLEGDVTAALNHPVGMDSATAVATMVYWGEEAGKFIEILRGQFPANTNLLRVSVSLVNGLLVARWLGNDEWILRTAYGACWEYLRHLAAALPPRLPRLWYI